MAMPPQGPQPQGQPGQAPQDPSQQGQPPAGQDQSGAGIGQLLQSVEKAIDHIAQVVGGSKAATPSEKQLIGVVNDAYGKFMESVSGQSSDDDGDESDAQGQTTAPEAAGNSGAIPHPY